MEVIYVVASLHDKNGKYVRTIGSHDTASGNYPQVVEVILQKASPETELGFYSIGTEYVLYMYREEFLQLSCMVPVKADRVGAIELLERLKRKIKLNFSRRQLEEAKQKSLNEKLGELFNEVMNQMNAGTE